MSGSAIPEYAVPGVMLVPVGAVRALDFLCLLFLNHARTPATTAAINAIAPMAMPAMAPPLSPVEFLVSVGLDFGESELPDDEASLLALYVSLATVWLKISDKSLELQPVDGDLTTAPPEELDG